MTREHCDKCDLAIGGNETPSRLICDVPLVSWKKASVWMRCTFDVRNGQPLTLCKTCADELYEQATHSEIVMWPGYPPTTTTSAERKVV